MDKHIEIIEKLAKKWTSFSEVLFEKKTKEEILNYLYNEFKATEDPIFVYLYLEYVYEYDVKLKDTELKEFVLYFLNYDKTSRDIFIYIDENKELIELFKEDSTLKHFSHALITYYENLKFDSFYDYEICIEVLCKFYGHFKDCFKNHMFNEYEETYLQTLYRCISNSGEDDYGYAYKGLKKVKEYISCLSEDLVIKLLWKFERNTLYNNITVKQVQAIVSGFYWEFEKYRIMKYFFVDRRILEEDITESIGFELRKVCDTNQYNIIKIEKNNKYEKQINKEYELLRIKHRVEEENQSIKAILVYQKDYSSTYKVIKEKSGVVTDILEIHQFFSEKGEIKVKINKTINYPFLDYYALSDTSEVYKTNREDIVNYIKVKLNELNINVDGIDDINDDIENDSKDVEEFHQENEEEFQLVYLWLGNYKGLFKEGEEFNFTSQYEFRIINKVLDYKEINTNYPNNFFYVKDKEYSKLRNITAVVGKNGSGKTSLLRFIMENFNYININDENNRFAVIFKKNDEFHLFRVGIDEVEIRKDKIIDWTNLLEEKEQKHPFKEKLNIIPYLRDDTHIVYFSNIFDFSKTNKVNNVFDPENVYIDISSQTIFYDDYNKDDINHLKSSEIARQINFLYSEYKDLVLENKKIDLYLYLTDPFKEFYKESDVKLYNEIDRFIEKIKDRYKTDNILEVTLYIIKLTLLECAEIFSSQDKGDYLGEFLELLNEMVNIEETSLIKYITLSFRMIGSKITKRNGRTKKTDLYKENSIIIQKKTVDIVEYGKQLPHRKNLILLFQKNINKLDINIENALKIPINNRSFAFNKGMIKEYQQSNFTTKIIDFGLSELSSGQRAMLLQYSKFYWLFNRDDKASKLFLDYTVPKLKKNLIVLIDEGEVLFHPEWQRQYLYNMIYFIERLTKNNEQIKNIQIILTSNSPFILSDLPKDNVILMAFKDEKCQRCTNEGDKEKTFGSNIHTLFANSFFLDEKGVMGEFAKDKISKVIKALNEKKLGGFTERELLYIIEAIGEPMIRTKLEEMLLLCDFNHNKEKQVEDIDKEIKRLQKEKENLLNRKNGND